MSYYTAKHLHLNNFDFKFCLSTEPITYKNDKNRKQNDVYKTRDKLPPTMCYLNIAATRIFIIKTLTVLFCRKFLLKVNYQLLNMNNLI